ncbi:MAG: histidine--tRNA ligase [Candidatus Omnitrophica bacterium]|nr:Histidine--tRNA ligase [bacterium]NUN98573.1 histidine--tRNA ligase [Candidatus Omnitrophota bacterium]
MTETQQPITRLVEPMTLKGFRDYLPEEMIARNRVVETIRRVYEKYGFVPIDTPVLEYLVTLIGTGGEETNKQLFRLESPESEPIAMRFDLTVPFARLIAQYPDKVKLPFRRYHIGPVFRADKPGPGRYRQFTQFDIDAAGSDSVAVDAEVIAAMCEALGELGLSREDGAPEYRIQVNSRKLMDALLEDGGVLNPETQKHVLRVIDKLPKVGMENVRKELGPGRIDESGDPIRGVGLNSETIERLVTFVSSTGKSRLGVVEAVEALLAPSETTTRALAEMRELAACLDSLGVSESEAVFDPSLARGLDYYTGPIFEAVLPGVPQIGSIMGGGRYDQLAHRFLDGRIPATGASIGLDRLMDGLAAVGQGRAPLTNVQAFVVAMKGIPTQELLKVASELRGEGIPTEVFMGDPKAGMKDQLSHANAREIPVAIMLGPDELSAGKISVKNLIVGKEQREGIGDREGYVKAGKVGQVTVARTELVGTVKQMLES